MELERYRAQQKQSAEEEMRSKLAGRIIDPSKEKKGSYSADDITAPGVSLDKPALEASLRDTNHRDSRNRDVVGSSSSSSRAHRDRAPQDDNYRVDERPRETRDRSRSRDQMRRDSRDRRDETREDHHRHRRSPSSSNRSRSPPRNSGDHRERPSKVYILRSLLANHGGPSRCARHGHRTTVTHFDTLCRQSRHEHFGCQSQQLR